MSVITESDLAKMFTLATGHAPALRRAGITQIKFGPIELTLREADPEPGVIDGENDDAEETVDVLKDSWTRGVAPSRAVAKPPKKGR